MTPTEVDMTADRIRTRAFEIYQARNFNGGTGDEASDWLQAERELSASARQRENPGALEVTTRANKQMARGR